MREGRRCWHGGCKRDCVKIAAQMNWYAVVVALNLLASPGLGATLAVAPLLSFASEAVERLKRLYTPNRKRSIPRHE